MEPITRTQLQNAAKNAVAEKEALIHRAQELKGQLAAEEFYKEIRRTAEAGYMTYASSKSMSLGLAFDTMLTWIKEHFPDCDVSTEIRHMEHSPTYAVRVDWSERIQYPPPTADLETRRLEKETSW